MLLKNRTALVQWYNQHKRILPWRNNKNPYLIWISEVMLQQTTVNAVIPYYKRFIKKFKTLKKLAQADIKEVLPYWSGLGYYNRIKNLHKAAKIIYKQKYFPKSYKRLLKLPGFGPYTSRAVSSLAFNENTTVLDANVIRVLCRYYGLKIYWWNTAERNNLQMLADQWTRNTKSPAEINQALMELGALVCLNRQPYCPACPLNKNCQAYKHSAQHLIPIKKLTRKKEIWLWKPIIITKNTKTAFIKNINILPFLKNHLIFPGKAVRKNQAPKKYHLIHFITHHAIYVQVCSEKQIKHKNFIWLSKPEIKQRSPSSLIQKVLLQ